ncbi:3'-5' exonuclease [Phocaeicola oris]|uniref:3'-5' exonuclease n=1 Tax=Phocaeicola oris TaxID=2896850 RepID=UPI00234EDF08|nr:3'-5' exonuclease [Phocaeicola oris]MCE2617325.1 3'-5' exonuclease [Phocaeicola oris]
MDNFAAIDFETANNQLSSVCSVGVVIYRNGERVDEFYSLIHPEPNYYLYRNIQVHGITERDTWNAPIFPKVWEQVAPKIEGLPLVAHNKRFDECCLKAVFKTYCMDYPDYIFYCTYLASLKLKGLENHQLQTVAAYFGYDLLTHHHALSDADACSWIAKKLL